MRNPNPIVKRLAAVLTALVVAFAMVSTAARETEPVVLMGALAHATTAMEETMGGKVLEIRLADEKGEPVFEAALKKGQEVIYVRIASSDEDVIQIKASELPSWLASYKLEPYMRSIDKAELPLVEAIGRAERRSAAPAIGAGLAKPLSGSNAVLAYYVETIKGSKRELLAVDAKNGAFIENPSELYEAHTPVKLARRLAP